jgi:hypothetical protein
MMSAVRRLSSVVVILALVGCGGGAATRSPVAPAPDRPTFLFFYTDG